MVTNGRVKPSKQMMLGLTIKSLTSSGKVVTVLNRYGHCISYNAAEELETELTFTAHEKNKIIPNGISPFPGLCTHVAFDNFDRIVDTVNGKETLHDTVGIIYQFIPQNHVPENSSPDESQYGYNLEPNAILYGPLPNLISESQSQGCHCYRTMKSKELYIVESFREKMP